MCGHAAGGTITSSELRGSARQLPSGPQGQEGLNLVECDLLRADYELHTSFRHAQLLDPPLLRGLRIGRGVPQFAADQGPALRKLLGPQQIVKADVQLLDSFHHRELRQLLQEVLLADGLQRILVTQLSNEQLQELIAAGLCGKCGGIQSKTPELL